VLAYRLRSFARLRRAWARNAVEVLRKADRDGDLDPELLARFMRGLSG
jgi:hypothetical protein